MRDDRDIISQRCMRLTEKVCVVTGAGQGIGRATARRLGAEGAEVIIAERNESSAVATREQIIEFGGVAHVVVSDLSSFAGACDLMEHCENEFGQIDVLVNCVGGTIWWQHFHEYREDQILLELERSLLTALWSCRAAIPYMLKHSRGSIINFGSSVSKGGLYRTPYAVSKGGVEVLTKTLAAEYGVHGIRVNGVSPGTVHVSDRSTSRLVLRPGVEVQAAPGTEQRVDEARLHQSNALRRSGRPEEIASAVAFLASDDSSFVTGHMIDCSGGII
jgi:NAD(P)-dependent dehydrogenase (short-subunit alcohol dehydrogenase family)